MYSCISQQTLHHALAQMWLTLGILAPRSWYCFGFLRKFTNSIISSLASSHPATSLHHREQGSPTHQPVTSNLVLEETQIFSPKLCLDVGLLVDHLGCGLADSKDTLSTEKVASDDTQREKGGNITHPSSTGTTGEPPTEENDGTEDKQGGGELQQFFEPVCL